MVLTDFDEAIRKVEEMKIKGWKFRQERWSGVDGSSTRESLIAEKKRLAARVSQIPILMAQKQRSVKVMTDDMNWLKSLSNLKRKRWEKDHRKDAGATIRLLENRINTEKAAIQSLASEKSRIPEQLSAIEKQLNTLVEGESKGLEKGLDKESAQALGELEVQKQTNQLEHEKNLQNQQLESQRMQLQKEAEAKAGASQNKWFLILGISALVVIGGIAWYKRNQAAKLANNINLKPVMK